MKDGDLQVNKRRWQMFLEVTSPYRPVNCRMILFRLWDTISTPNWWRDSLELVPFISKRTGGAEFCKDWLN